MDGILNINKPYGKTSHDIVARIRRLTGEKRVGHAGTLDPAATGVLPICLGQGTRVIEYLQDTSKSYEAGIELGITTDTYDATGSVIQRNDPSGITAERLAAALNAFRGTIRQTPPMFSAVKHQGYPLYKLARAGIEVPRQSRPVQIHRLEVTAWHPPFLTLEIECSKGTYIRALAHDLGQTLGCGAILQNLVRTRCGVFNLADAVPLARFEEAVRGGYWQCWLSPVDSVLLHWSAAVVNEAAEDALKKGKPVKLPDAGGQAGTPLTFCRAYNLDGRFFGILRYLPETGFWQPEKVLTKQSPVKPRNCPCFAPGNRTDLDSPRAKG